MNSESCAALDSLSSMCPRTDHICMWLIVGQTDFLRVLTLRTDIRSFAKSVVLVERSETLVLSPSLYGRAERDETRTTGQGLAPLCAV